MFGFNKSPTHGFPNKPTCVAWDPELKLLVLGTRTGGLRLFGQPGVELVGQHENEAEVAVEQIVIVPGQGRMVTVTADNTLHMWEINDNRLVEVSKTHMEGRLKKVTVCCLESARSVATLLAMCCSV